MQHAFYGILFHISRDIVITIKNKRYIMYNIALQLHYYNIYRIIYVILYIYILQQTISKFYVPL